MPVPCTSSSHFTVFPSEDRLANALDYALDMAINDAEAFDSVIRRLPKDIHPQDFGRFASLYLAIILRGKHPKPTGRQMVRKAMDIDIVQTATIVGAHLKSAQQAAVSGGLILLGGPLSAGLSKYLAKSLRAPCG